MGDPAEDLVAGRVPVGVVDLLEAVEVEEDEAEVAAVAAAALELAAEHLVEVAVVVEPGERVLNREPLLGLVERRVGQRDRRLGRVGREQLDVAGEEALVGAEGDEHAHPRVAEDERRGAERAERHGPVVGQLDELGDRVEILDQRRRVAQLVAVVRPMLERADDAVGEVRG